MPILKCEENGKPGYKYGDSGKCYTYTSKDEISRNKARKNAIIQGIAVTKSGGKQILHLDMRFLLLLQ